MLNGGVTVKWKFRAILFIAVIIIEIPLLKIGINPVIAIFTTFIVIMVGYFIWWGIKTKKLNNLLDENCDPYRFIQECEKVKLISDRIPFQNNCNVNIAVGLISLGDNKEALNILQDVDLSAKNSKVVETLYHLAIFCCYINMDDLTNATFEYENHIKRLRKKVIIPRMVFSIDATVSEYQYKLCKTVENAKYSLGQLDYLYNIYSKKIGKRMRLNVLYNKAELMWEIGDNEGAAEKYKIVAEKGNKLWIADMSRNKLGGIGS